MTPSAPLQYELWADLSLQNRHLRRNNWLHWVVHLVLVAALALAFLRPLVAIRVDSLGGAQLIDNVSPVNGPGPEEAEHVSRLLSAYLLEVTSGAVGRDLSKALGLMTQDFARAYREKAKEDATLLVLEKGNVRTQLSFDSKYTEVKVQKDAQGSPERYFVQLFGRVDVFRADVLTAPLLSRQVRVRTTLAVVPRTPATLNGLLVDFFEKDYSAEDAPGAVIDSNPFPPATAPGVTVKTKEHP